MSSYLPVVVTKRARSRIERATTWWQEEKRPASPQALVEELSRVFELLSATPMLGQPSQPKHAASATQARAILSVLRSFRGI